MAFPKQHFLLALLLMGAHTLLAQQLISHTLLGTRTKEQLITQFNFPLIQYGAKYYRIIYTTPDVKGVQDTVSGLLVVPDAPGKIWPRLVYQHGTASSKLGVPSFEPFGGEGQVGALFAGLGYVAHLPDYVGLGVSEGIHPYVHAETEAGAALDLLRAARPFLESEKVAFSKQLFITGYSQGGHAAMALHRAIETNPQSEFSVTAAAHLSGPYSISGVMRGLIIGNGTYFYPAYIPNTMLSYQSAYGNIFKEITDIMLPPYAAEVEKFVKGSIDLGQLNTNLINLLVTNEGLSKPRAMLRPDILSAVENDLSHPINVALRANDVYDWKPNAPTRIFYCTADDQVPYRNSVVAFERMKANGTADLQATDVNTTADHGQCVVPALTNTVLFFLGLQRIDMVNADYTLATQPLAMSPNPAIEETWIKNLPSTGRLEAYDCYGRLHWTTNAAPGEVRITVADWPQGTYLLRFIPQTISAQSPVLTHTLLVAH